MKRGDTVYLRHILDAIGQIEDYLEGVSLAQFVQTKLLQDGVVRELEIIGEASRSLSSELRESHAEVPWHLIIGLRNRISHDYVNVNLQIIWEIAQDDLPILRQQVANILEEKWAR